jgi:hypothetical protein
LSLFRSAAALSAALLLMPAGALANDPVPAPASAAAPASEIRPPQRLGRSIALVRRQAERHGVPADLAQAVMMAESEGDPTRTGATGEFGLMGLRLSTAMMLGFRGDGAELLDPALNASYGVAHLAQAWRIAEGDPCRAYVKYRTHYGEERLAGRHGQPCLRLRTALSAMSSPLAERVAAGAPPAEAKTVAAVPEAKPAEPRPAEPKPAVEAKAPAVEPKAEPAVTGAVAVDHPLPPTRPRALAASRPAPKAKVAARQVSRGKAATRAAAKASGKAASGVSVVAKAGARGRATMTCQGKTCTLTRAAAKR